MFHILLPSILTKPFYFLATKIYFSFIVKFIVAFKKLTIVIYYASEIESFIFVFPIFKNYHSGAELDS